MKQDRLQGTSPESLSSAAASGSDAGGIAGRVREQANAQLSSQKDRALDGLGGVAQAVRKTTESLREQKHDTVARYVEQAADQVERFTQNLRNKDVGELLQDAQRLARRQPALFVGSAFAVGLLGARFFKSSADDRTDEYGYGRSYQTNQGTSRYGRADYRTALPTAGTTGASSSGVAGTSPSTNLPGRERY